LLSHDEKRRKRLRGSVNFTAIMTFVSVLALVLLYLALSGISKGQEDLRRRMVYYRIKLCDFFRLYHFGDYHFVAGGFDAWVLQKEKEREDRF
ncbi:MAG TPA: hypothetical protein DFI01_08195, partial [Bacteroidales bacterium]|nr:hypothetical protein [Bacteroidales bacterium]